jgi:hypothetical protein
MEPRQGAALGDALQVLGQLCYSLLDTGVNGVLWLDTDRTEVGLQDTLLNIF